ncbi:MAG: DUF167 domain-containing protein [Pseudomonadota bacterium]
MEWIKEKKNGYLLLYVKLIPNASKTEISEITDELIKIKVTEAPIDNKANQALIKFLAKKLGLSKGLLKIIKGEKSKEKTIRIEFATKAQLLKLILKT